jgi:NAD(P)-dependent dehydrogenase (short-subunit alcohol dehydrogenase family)
VVLVIALSLVPLSLLRKTKAKILEVTPNAEVILIANVSDAEYVQNYVNKIVENFSETDSFFNNAGIEQNIKEDFDNDEFAKVLSINLNGVFYGLKYVLRVMK